MKNLSISIFLALTICFNLFGQDNFPDEKEKNAIYTLIDQYSLARDTKDSILLKKILTGDVDQLVSSGEWRYGIEEAISGMMRSSAANPGDRQLIVDNIRVFNSKSGIVDCRYEIKNSNGSVRKMWSTFFITYSEDSWKIAGIRNMLPAPQE
ncbi:MAG: DUF4440 domain-containing protein [Cyclobacteriaceae bacterium]